MFYGRRHRLQVSVILLTAYHTEVNIRGYSSRVTISRYVSVASGT